MIFYLVKILIVPFVKAFIISAIGLLLTGVKVSLKRLMILSLAIAVTGLVIHPAKLPLGGLTMLHIMIFSLAAFIILRIPYKISFITAVIGICIQVSVKTFVLAVFHYITKGFGLSLQSDLIGFLMLFMEDLSLAVLALTLKKYHINIWSSKDTADNGYYVNDISFNKTLPMVILFFSQIILVLLFFFGDYPETHYPITINQNFFKHPFITLIISMLPIIAIIITKKQITTIQNEISYKNKVDSLEIVDELLENIQIKQHDFKHELQVVYGLLEIGEIKEARNFISKSFSEISATSEIIKTNDVRLTALLYAKICIADRLDIRIDIDIDSSFCKNAKYGDDLYITLGNLIDNALEVSINNKPNEKKVSVALKSDKGNCIIAVRSYGKSIGSSLVMRIFDFGFTSKEDGKGIGLYSVKKIVKKHNGKIGVSYVDGQNCFEIVMPAQDRSLNIGKGGLYAENYIS